jgi:hypothetical protein
MLCQGAPQVPPDSEVDLLPLADRDARVGAFLDPIVHESPRAAVVCRALLSTSSENSAPRQEATMSASRTSLSCFWMMMASSSTSLVAPRIASRRTLLEIFIFVIIFLLRHDHHRPRCDRRRTLLVGPPRRRPPRWDCRRGHAPYLSLPRNRPQTRTRTRPPDRTGTTPPCRWVFLRRPASRPGDRAAPASAFLCADRPPRARTDGRELLNCPGGALQATTSARELSARAPPGSCRQTLRLQFAWISLEYQVDDQQCARASGGSSGGDTTST